MMAIVPTCKKCGWRHPFLLSKGMFRDHIHGGWLCLRCAFALLERLLQAADPAPGPHVCDLPPHEVRPADLVGTWGTHGGSVQVPSMRSVLDETESFIEIEGGRLRKAKPAEKDGGK